MDLDDIIGPAGLFGQHAIIPDAMEATGQGTPENVPDKVSCGEYFCLVGSAPAIRSAALVRLTAAGLAPKGPVQLKHR